MSENGLCGNGNSAGDIAAGESSGIRYDRWTNGSKYFQGGKMVKSRTSLCQRALPAGMMSPTMTHQAIRRIKKEVTDAAIPGRLQLMNNIKKRIFSMLPLALPVALSAADVPPGRKGDLTV